MSASSNTPNRPMTRERWERLAPLVDAVLDQPADRRLEYIAEISGGNAALAEELARFISSYGEQEENETTAASIFAAANVERSALISERLRDAASDLLAQLRASLGATYVIEREIGGGGMARVFVAEETGLGRKVVIKVLPPEMAEEISAERFAREIKVAASLQQANIVPVLAAGTAAGFPYYTMPFVEGLSLRERLLREGAPPVNEAISILRDVARALAFAHSRGVIHRDIKPGNILLSDRTAVVTDFGIAKALGAAREGRAGAPHDSPSHTGTLGTPAYMAPEQASSDPNLDHRADIYSFGCVAFELLTGKPPFDGAAPHDLIAAHLHETPWREIELPSEIPVAVAQLVATCLEKATSRRPQSADEVLRALDGAANQPIAFPPRRSRRMTFATSTVVLVTGIAVAYPAFRASEPLTLAAVPFRDLTRDTAIGHWSDGISDEILNRMAKVKGLRIVGRAAAFRYRSFVGLTDPSDQAFERELGARLFLTGKLSEAEGRVIVSVQLSDSKSRGEIWSDSFSGGSRELGSITDEIVRRVTDALRARYGERIGRGATTPDSRDGAALDQDMIGKEQLRRRGSGVEQAIENIESVVRAIDLGSNFASAHARLAAALDLRVFVLEGPPDRLIARPVTKAPRALALDGTLADILFADAHATAGEWEASDSVCRHVLELEPDNAMVRQYFGRSLILRGATGGIGQLERALTVEPKLPFISAELAYAYFLEGHPDLALAESERAIKLGPRSANATLALLNLGLGRNDVARRLIGMTGRPAMAQASYVYAKLGDMVSANRIIREVEAMGPRSWPVDVVKAGVFLATGDTAKALTALERSSRYDGAQWVFYIPPSDPAFDPVRKSARFAELLRRAHIESRVITNPRRGN